MQATDDFSDANYTLSSSIQYDTSSGYLLGNSLCLNSNQYCFHNGYVSSVSLRLFNQWEGDASLYLFIIGITMYGMSIIRRYPVEPQRNTTEWQTIEIPSHAFPIFLGNLLAVGMQDKSDTNQIYIVQSVAGMFAKDVNENIQVISLTSSFSDSVAFSYVVTYLAETRAIKTIPSH